MKRVRTSGGPNDDRRVVLFRGGRRIATVGDMRDPIAFVRSERVPDDADAFIQKMKPYYQTWAAMLFGKRRPVGDSNADPNITHTFYIRACDEKISIQDYIVLGNELFKVKSVQPLGIHREFLSIATTDWATYTQELEEAGLETSPVLQESQPAEVENTTFWDQTADAHED